MGRDKRELGVLNNAFKNTLLTNPHLENFMNIHDSRMQNIMQYSHPNLMIPRKKRSEDNLDMNTNSTLISGSCLANQWALEQEDENS